MGSGMLPGMASRMTDKVTENRLRRMAARQNLVLQKSRRRDERAYDFGTFRLVDARTGALVAGDQIGYGLTLERVEEVLTTPR